MLQRASKNCPTHCKGNIAAFINWGSYPYQDHERASIKAKPHFINETVAKNGRKEWPLNSYFTIGQLDCLINVCCKDAITWSVVCVQPTSQFTAAYFLR